MERRMFPTRSHSENYPELDSGERSDAVAINQQCFSESAPLKSSLQQRPHFCSPKRNGFKIIILSLVTISLATTIALIIEIYNHNAVVLKPHSMVVSDNSICSEIGASLLAQGGSAVDGIVATALCLGVVHPHDIGLGGGGFMIIHDHKQGKTVSLDFRESLPSAFLDVNSTTFQGHLVGVPGFLHGLATAHKLFGKLLWSDLVRPAVRIARTGFNISPYLNQTIPHGNSSTIRNLFFKATGETIKLIRRKNLAKILDLIGIGGVGAFYNGTIAKTIVHDVNKLGGQLSVEDFAKYETIVSEPLEINWRGFTLQTSPIPSSGHVLLKSLKVLEDIVPDVKMNKSLPINEVLKAVRTAFADYLNLSAQVLKQNVSKIKIDSTVSETEDESFSFPWRESRGSSVVAVDDDELFVSLVSGLGSWFGSDIVTSNEIVMNDALMDVHPDADINFSMNDTKRNWRPPSTLTPFIMFNKDKICGFRLAAGGASPTMVLQTILRKAVLGHSLREAVEAPRFDVAFLEKQVYFEQEHQPHFRDETLNALTMDGYQVSSITEPYISVNAIAKENDETTGQADPRGGGNVANS